MPQISVIVPVYKVEPYLHRCIDSILAQTFSDFELILVDDGSPDNCGVICDEYAKKDSRIHVIHQENGGLSAARNAGIDWAFENSNSEWIAFVDSDDWIHPQYLEILFTGVFQMRTEISMCSIQKINQYSIDEQEVSSKFYSLPAMETLKPEDGSSGIDAYACGKLFRRTLFSNKRFPKGMIFEDFYLIPEIFAGVSQVSCSSEKLYYYFQRIDSIVQTANIKGVIDKYKGFEHQIRVFRNTYPELAKDTKRNCIIWLCNVYNSLLKTNINEAEIIRKLGAKFCVRHPFSIGFPFYPNVDILLAFFPAIGKLIIIFSKIKRKLHV